MVIEITETFETRGIGFHLLFQLTTQLRALYDENVACFIRFRDSRILGFGCKSISKVDFNTMR